MSKSNENLHSAKKGKNDEFYTQYKDIQLELNHYEKHFEGKTVLCNCDDPYESNFCKFFLRNFNYLKLKRLICTSYSTSPVAGTQLSLFDYAEGKSTEGHGFVLDVTHIPMRNGRGISDDDIDDLLKSKKDGVKMLDGNGDFRSEECIEYLKQADIVCTNPAFSLFREYIAQLVKYDKKFLIIGNVNAITYKEVFPLIKENKMWVGYKFNGKPMEFIVPDDYPLKGNVNGYLPDGRKYIGVGGTCWYTNLDNAKRHEKLILYEHYYGNETEYPKYDNYDAINVDKTVKIPVDFVPCWFNCPASENCEWAQQKAECSTNKAYCYNEPNFPVKCCNGVMGVPITFLDKFNPEQFEIVAFRKGDDGKDLVYTKSTNSTEERERERIQPYFRILIRRLFWA